jgi:hypothetical protein
MTRPVVLQHRLLTKEAQMAEARKEVTGNKPKFKSYSEAWKRIKAAQEAGFYLEAIAIQESILSDRITSYLAYCGLLPKNKNPGLWELLEAWKRDPASAKGEEFSDLRNAINDVWRGMRNDAIHGLVKSAPGTPTQDVDDFLSAAKCAAKLGEKLAREVSNWHDRQRKLTKQTLKKSPKTSAKVDRTVDKNKIRK